MLLHYLFSHPESITPNNQDIPGRCPSYADHFWPTRTSSLPRLKLVQAGIQRTHAKRTHPPNVRMPITPAILRQMHAQWSPNASDTDVAMLWAASTVCFFGFFRAGEITVPSQGSFNPARHLSWGDVAVDSKVSPKVIRVTLKFSKTNQLGKGTEVYLGRTGCSLCPVAATLAYMLARGDQPGQFFRFKNGELLRRQNLSNTSSQRSKSRSSSGRIRWAQLQDWSSYSSS